MTHSVKPASATNWTLVRIYVLQEKVPPRKIKVPIFSRHRPNQQNSAFVGILKATTDLIEVKSFLNMSKLPTEKSSLLASSESDVESISLVPGQFNGESLEVAEMKKTLHNDPNLRILTEDMHKLYGSTRMLLNAVAAHSHDKLSTSLRRTSVSAQGLAAVRRESIASRVYNQQRESAVLFLEKVKSTFFEDTRSLAEGTIPQSIVVALTVGVVCGVAAWLYYSTLNFMLDLLWKVLPEKYVVGSWKEENYWLWIPLVSFVMLIFVGLTVVFLGEPGDLPYTISRVHHYAYIPMDHTAPMFVASMFSILAGGSLGPEAPLVAICGALGGFVSRRIFRQKYVNVVRKHTLMGVSPVFVPCAYTFANYSPSSKCYFFGLIDGWCACSLFRCSTWWKSVCFRSLLPIWDRIL